MRRILTLAVFLTLITAAVASPPWYYPRQGAKSYVNPYLTPQRVFHTSWKPSWNGQLVLWQGRASQVQSIPPQRLILKGSGHSDIEVRFSREVKNLQVDREGAIVAVKGRVQRDTSGKIILEGRSLIPWSPPHAFHRDQAILPQWVAFSRPELPLKVRQAIVSHITKEAFRQRIDPLLLAALIQVESGFDPKAVSESGAIGLGQLMPATARGLGVDPTDIGGNIRGCAAMLGNLLHRYAARKNGRALALASYNAGPTLVARTLTVPPYEQTVNYVYFIGALHHELSRQQKNYRR